MKLRGYRPPPLPKPPRKSSQWIKKVVFPPIPEPDRSQLPDPHTYDSKGSNTRVAAWLFLGLALATGLALGLALWQKQTIHACAGSCGKTGGSLHAHPPRKGDKPPQSGSPGAPTR
jgi:hypothetical protein